MSYSFGGAVIETIDFTRSWGLSPASGSVTCVGDTVVAVGGDAILNIAGSVFHGVLTSVVADQNDGTKLKLGFVDNRIKLMWDDVYGLFNRVEVREDNPATPGIDRSKRYVHILPSDWATQKKTYTRAALSAGQIITYLMGAPTVRFSWSSVFHSLQNSKAPHEIDCLNGKKLGNALQEVADSQGLVLTLVGQNQLHWAIKGEGAVPGFDLTNTDARSTGSAVSAVDTRVRVVGDRNRYQDLSVALEPDWKSGYQEFWAEPAWLAEVAAIIGGGGDSFSEKASLAAKARRVTVREYVALKGSAYADYGMWGEVSRMEIPVWTYLQDIVFKAYRVPRSYTFRGLPLDSLELVEGQLAAVDYTLAGELSYKTPREYYPDTKAFALVKGQQLSLLDPTKQRVISPAQLAAAGTQWSPNNRFNLDTRNKVLIFEDTVFIPGSGATGLFVFPNAGVEGASESLKAIAVPNANVTVTPAAVRASLVWEAEKYNRIYGSGYRTSPVYVQGLARHTLAAGASSIEEITYADEQTADLKSADVAATLILRSPVYESGGYRRNGACGTQLTGAIDRVTVTLNFSEGLTERVELSKERSQSNFASERDLERRQRSKDLFPGQRALGLAVQQLDTIALISKELKRNGGGEVYRSLSDTMEKPVGAADCSVAKIYSDDIWLAGMPVMLGADDKPAEDGTRFGGIVIAENASGVLPCATQGIVPVRVKGPIEVNDDIGIDPGADETAKKNGQLHLGKANAAYAGSGTVLLPVRLGSGGASDSGYEDFRVFPVVDPGPTPGPVRIGVDFGNVTAQGIALDTDVEGYPAEFAGVDAIPKVFPITAAHYNAETKIGYAYLKVTVNPDPAGDLSLPPKVTAFNIGRGSPMPSNSSSFTYPLPNPSIGYLILAVYQFVEGEGDDPDKVVVLNNTKGIGSVIYSYCGGAHYFWRA